MLSPVSVIDYSEGNIANDPEMSSTQIEIRCALQRTLNTDSWMCVEAVRPSYLIVKISKSDLFLAIFCIWNYFWSS